MDPQPHAPDPAAAHASEPAATPGEALLLARRIEEASLNAWPALQQIFLDGWILRFAKGFTKRSNSIVPLYPPAQNEDDFSPAAADWALAEKIRHCENLYAREQLQTVFRLTSIMRRAPNAGPDLDSVLAERGYRLDETSLVLSKPIRPGALPAEFKLLPLDTWLSAYCELTGMPEPARTLHGVILKGIAGDCGFGILQDRGRTVACGLAVVERELVGLFDIFTHPQERNAGVGARMVNGLLAWAAEQGASRAYLQMVEDNAPAASLYSGLGFNEIYRYWYRIGS